MKIPNADDAKYKKTEAAFKEKQEMEHMEKINNIRDEKKVFVTPMKSKDILDHKKKCEENLKKITDRK